MLNEAQAGFGGPPSVNAGARSDRLPPGRFHRRVMILIGVGMFVDACDMDHRAMSARAGLPIPTHD